MSKRYRQHALHAADRIKGPCEVLYRRTMNAKGKPVVKWSGGKSNAASIGNDFDQSNYVNYDYGSLTWIVPCGLGVNCHTRNGNPLQIVRGPFFGHSDVQGIGHIDPILDDKAWMFTTQFQKVLDADLVSDTTVAAMQAKQLSPGGYCDADNYLNSNACVTACQSELERDPTSAISEMCNVEIQNFCRVSENKNKLLCTRDFVDYVETTAPAVVYTNPPAPPVYTNPPAPPVYTNPPAPADPAAGSNAIIYIVGIVLIIIMITVMYFLFRSHSTEED